MPDFTSAVCLAVFEEDSLMTDFTSASHWQSLKTEFYFGSLFGSL